MKNAIRVLKNSGNGGLTALQIPTGMTGKQLTKWKNKNSEALQAAKAEVIAETVREVVMPISEETSEETSEEFKRMRE